MTKSTLAAVIAILLVSLAPSDVNAAILQWDEAVSGEADYNYTFDLVEGLNVWTGTIESSESGATNDADLVRFTLPTDLSTNAIIKSVKLELTDIGGTGLPIALFYLGSATNTVGTPDNDFRIDWRLPNAPPSFGPFFEELNFLTERTGGDSFNLNSGYFGLGYNGFVALPGIVSYRVELDIEVNRFPAPVPLPASLPLLFLCLLALGFLPNSQKR